MDSCRCVHGQVFIAAILPTAAGFLGDRCRNANPWYTGLKKPTWALPVKSVGCLRAIFNVGIGYASYLVYRDGDGFDGILKKK